MSDATPIDFLSGRGEEARLAFYVADAKWDDGRLATPGDTRRATTPYAGLPPMTGNRGSLDPVSAILLHIGLQLGMHPLEEEEAERHEAVLRSVEDLRRALLEAPDDSAAAAAQWVAEVEGRLGPGPFLAGEKLSITDLRLFTATGFLSRAEGPTAAALEASAALRAHRAAVQAHPRVASWFAR